ncbi:hypothetical protein [Streptomyces sp. NPDC086777]|uniref:hypothetical protein n=1 Tax=Streptomyces sp. NPDC086777 TaxID=3154866 RepID=UPI0034501A45
MLPAGRGLAGGRPRRPPCRGGHSVTLVKDATGAFVHEGMHAAHAINGPTFAHAILTTEELLAQLG